MPDYNKNSIEKLEPAKNGQSVSHVKNSIIKIVSRSPIRLRSTRRITTPDETAAAGYPRPSIPDGTYGRSGRTAIWAWGDGIGLRFVKLRWYGDQVLATACGGRKSWTGWSLEGDTLSGRQFEYCLGDYGIGYIAAYVGDEELILKGELMGGSSLIESAPEVNYEDKWFGFC